MRESAPFIRRDLQIFLEKRNIQTRTVFTGNILRQPGFKHVASKASKNTLIAIFLAKNDLSKKWHEHPTLLLPGSKKVARNTKFIDHRRDPK